MSLVQCNTHQLFSGAKSGQAINKVVFFFFFSNMREWLMNDQVLYTL